MDENQAKIIFVISSKQLFHPLLMKFSRISLKINIIFFSSHTIAKGQLIYQSKVVKSMDFEAKRLELECWYPYLVVDDFRQFI